MERAAASAAEFKLSFEWLGAYVATISEQTRLAPEIIGTSMKSLLSRLYAIRETGFNDEDDVNLNQVSKALAEIDVALMDSAGNWRSFSDIMNDISNKWGTIDDKQRAYISTTMAGIRQQNVFLALMRDLAKGIEGGSRAWELYEGAMESNGAATDKYAIRMESVAAAQKDMQNSLEGLYGTIMSGTVMKDFYTMVAEFVDTLKAGVETLGEIDVKAVALVATIGAAGLAIVKVIKVIKAAAVGGSLLGGLNFRTAITGLTALATVIIAVAGKIKQAADPIKSFGDELERLSTSQEKWNSKIDDLSNYEALLEGVKNSTMTSAEKQLEYNNLLKNLVENTPSLTSALRDTNGEWKNVDDALGAVNEKMREYAKLRDQEANTNAKRALLAFPEQIEEQMSKLSNFEKLLEYLQAVKNWSTSTASRGSAEEGNLGLQVMQSRDAAIPGLQELASIFGFNKDMSYGGNIDSFMNKMIDDGIDTYIDAATTMLDVAGDEIKQEIVKFKMQLVTAMTTTEGFRESPGFIREMITDYTEELITQLENADFTGANAGNLQGALFTLFDQGTTFADDTMGNIPKLMAERVAKAWQGATANGKNVWPTLADEILSGFGDSLIPIEQNLDKYFPKEFADAYWTNFVNNLFLGYTPQEMMSMVNAESSPFTMLQTQTARLFEEVASSFGAGEADITAGFNSIMGMAPDEKNRGYLSNIFKLLFGDLTIQQYETMLNALKKGENINNMLIEWTNLPESTGTASENIDGASESLKNLTAQLDEYMKKAKVVAAESKNFIPQLQALYGGYGEFGQKGFETEYDKLDPEMIEALWSDENASKIMTMMLNGAGLAEIIAELTTLMTNTDMESANDNLDKTAERFKTLLGIMQGIEGGEGISFDAAVENLEAFPELMELMGKSLEEQSAGVYKLLSPERKSLFDTLLERMMVGHENATPEFKASMAELVNTAISTMIEEMRAGQDEAAEAWKEFISTIKGEVDAKTLDAAWEQDGLSSYRDGYTQMLSGGDISGFATKMRNIQNPEVGSDYDRAVIEKLKDEWDGFAEAILLAESGATDFTAVLDKMAASSRKMKLDRAFGDAAGDFEDLQEGGKKAAKIIDSVTKESKDMKKALSAMSFVQQGQYKNQEELNEAYQAMGDYLGMSIEDANDFAAAQAMMSGATAQTGQYLNYFVGGLLAANAIQIDPSGKVIAMGSLEEAAAAAGMTVEEFAAALAAINGAGFNFQIDPDGLNGKVKSWVNQSALPKFKPSASSSGGGGGGGGGDGLSKEIQSFLDNLANSKEIQDFSREILNLRKEYHELRGEITAVISLTKKEIESLEQVSSADEEAEASLRSQMEAKQAEVASLKSGSKQYKQAVKDLEALQNAHKDYSKRIIENKNDLEKLTQEIKDFNDEIRQLEIDLRDELQQAFFDRDDLQQQMLESRVEMENLIIDTIRERYQEEWDLIEKDADIKRQALNDELKMIRENLNERKRIAEQDKKQEQLQTLEGQLAMISADPTRSKERLDLQKRIADLREELSWDAAEEEVKAQEESITKQIASLDEYLEFINNYYEEMFANPERLAQEMNEVMMSANDEMTAWLTENYIGFTTMTAEEQADTIDKMYQLAYSTDEALDAWMTEHIIGFAAMTQGQQDSFMEHVRDMAVNSNQYVMTWLEENNKEFANSTAANKELMRNEWEGTLISMHGATKTYWHEIEQIIEQGDDAILAFLMENSEKYRNASHLQQQAYRDGWQETLDNIKAAYKDAQDYMEANAYVPIPPTNTGGNGNGSGVDTGSWYIRDANGNKLVNTKYTSETLAWQAIESRLFAFVKQLNAMANVPGAWKEREAINAQKAIWEAAAPKGYTKGGYVDYTGLAAVHGSRTDPEAFLSAPDTKMIRGLLDVFNLIVPRFGGIKSPSNASGTITIEEINISVDKLDNDADLEDLANKVGEKFAKAMMAKRGMSVGNLRIK